MDNLCEVRFKIESDNKTQKKYQKNMKTITEKSQKNCIFSKKIVFFYPNQSHHFSNVLRLTSDQTASFFIEN